MVEWRDLGCWLDRACDPARTIAWRDGQPLREPEWRARAAGWSAALAGLEPGPVALWLEDPFEFSAALFAIWRHGRTAVLPGDFTAATRVALDRDVVAWICEPRADLRVLRPSVAIGDVAPPPRIAPAVRLFTSGSTGAPLPIEKRIDQLEAELHALEAELAEPSAEIVHASVSHQHIYGLLFRILWPMCAGRPFACERLQYPEQMAAALAARPCWFVSTPAHLGRLPVHVDWRAAAERVRRVFSSAAPLGWEDAQTAHRLLEEPVTEVFGSSETGGIAWRRRVSEDIAWNAFRGVAWRVEEDRLVLRSSFMPDRDAWLRTADRVEVVGDGFRLLGRADRIVKLEGRRVSLAAIERVLASSPGIAAAHALCVSAKRTYTAAVIELEPDTEVPVGAAQRRIWIERLRALLRGSIEPQAWPRLWRFVPPLERDARGKLPEARLRRLFEAELPEVSWYRRDDHCVVGSCVPSERLQVFSGHFPDVPVLPGVALLDWVARWSAESFSLAGPFVGMDQVKFQRIARPELRLHFELHCRAEGRRVDFEVRSEAGLHASGRLRFAEA